MLLDSNVQHDVTFLTIVGIGGLSKTALAQLVFNDSRIISAFPLRLWTCVSDQDQKQLDVKETLGKILGKNYIDSTMDSVKSQLREQLSGKKYLIVLDDVMKVKCAAMWSIKCTQLNKSTPDSCSSKVGPYSSLRFLVQVPSTVFLQHNEQASMENYKNKPFSQIS